jgi:hypothetical protein
MPGRELTGMDRIKRLWILDFGFEILDLKSQLCSISFAFILSIPVNFYCMI